MLHHNIERNDIIITTHEKNSTLSKMTLSKITLGVTIEKKFCYQWLYTYYSEAECRRADCRYTDCHFADCHSNPQRSLLIALLTEDLLKIKFKFGTSFMTKKRLPLPWRYVKVVAGNTN
jgi:hypothetical protein